MSYRLTVDQIVAIHRDVCTAPILDLAKLDGVVSATYESVFEQDRYPTVIDKAAKLLESIARVHAFADGNRRVAWLATLQHLEGNGVALDDIPAEDVDEFVRGMIVNRLSTAEVAMWILDHVV